MATEKGSVGWTDARFSRASVHPVPLPRHIAVEILWHNYSDAMHRPCISSSGVEDPASKSPLLASTRPSDRPTLHLDQGVWSSDAEGFVLPRLCLDSNWASDTPTVSPLRLSDHPVLLSSLLFLCNSSDATKKMDRQFIRRYLGFHPVYQLVRRLHRRLLYWYRRFIRWCLFFSFFCSVLTLDFLILACGFLASLGLRSVYKDMVKQYS
jgi:hypothetical protein